MSGRKCKKCWWYEGGRCYKEPCKRDETGRSKKEAIVVCSDFQSKRHMLTTYIPSDKLIILSELFDE